MEKFPELHIVEAQAKHTHTVILLHGRGSSGPEFAEELSEERTSGGKSLLDSFPGFRWVFPSAPMCWSTVFKEDMPEWFDTPSLSDISLHEELQLPGLRSSVAFVEGIVDAQVSLLGSSSRVFLGGISQGEATAVHALFRSKHRLGGFIGASGWLPLAGGIQELLLRENEISSSNVASKVTLFLARKLGLPDGGLQFRETPMLLMHGSDDQVVDVGLGRQARDVCEELGMKVVWNEYIGAEQDGHWLKEPEELDDIATFLTRNSSRNCYLNQNQIVAYLFFKGTIKF